MKRAIIVSDHGFVNGGQAKVAIETALALRAEGLEVTMFFGVGPADGRLRDAGVDCISLGQADLLGEPTRAKSALRGLWNFRAASVLQDVLSESDPNNTVVHVHGWAKSLSPSIGSVITSSAIPHVYTLHEYFLACPTGGFYNHAKQEICTLRPLSGRCLASNCDPRNQAHKMWRAARQMLLWNVGKMPTRLRDIIYLTETQLSVMRPFLPRECRLHWLPNSVARSRFERVTAELNDIYLFVGRLSPEKGGELAALAARRAGVRIAFAGEGEQRARILDANPDAIMLGWLKEAELDNWMSKARCLVFPSLWYECQPMVVIESMQRGVPVLVSSRCTATEQVRHGVDGLHVTNGNVDAWSAAMREMADSVQVESFSRSSFMTSSRFIDPIAYRQSLLRIYEEATAAQLAEKRNMRQ